MCEDFLCLVTQKDRGCPQETTQRFMKLYGYQRFISCGVTANWFAVHVFHVTISTGYKQIPCPVMSGTLFTLSSESNGVVNVASKV